MQAGSGSGGRLLVIGGNGFVGREVCRFAVQNGFTVTSLSRRGECPLPGDKWLSQVQWKAGNALDPQTVSTSVANADAVVHCIGLLFDARLLIRDDHTIFSQSAHPISTISCGRLGQILTPRTTTCLLPLSCLAALLPQITRKTAILVIEALKKRAQLSEYTGELPTPMAFVSAAEAGWPEVAYGDKVEEIAPDWLKEREPHLIRSYLRYLVAKRAVEAELERSTDVVRPSAGASLGSHIARPSFIWNYEKLDVLPLVPIFNIASSLGVPFVDKTVRVEDVGKAIVSGLLDKKVRGVQRYNKIEALSASIPIAKE
ncbi:MAG: hypothetical protein SGPRY_003486 [Prymnesium sp.]